MTDPYIDRRLSGFDTNGQKIELHQNALLVRAKNGPIVVLGDAGTGKTTLLKQLGRHGGFAFADARRLVRSPDPSELFGDATTMVIDALDELYTRAESEAVDRVLEALARAGKPDFILACRVADWRSATAIEAIRDDYDDKPLELFLEPISDEEARALLSAAVGEERASQVIAHFEGNGLAELFGNPQTLELIKKVSGEEALPTSRHGLFEMSTRLLATERSPTKTASRSGLSQLNESEIRDAAGSAFASLILTGKRALSRLPCLDVDEDDLPINELNAFTPRDRMDAVRESRLFEGIGDSADRFSYTHRSVGEFLAARWLSCRADTHRKRQRLLKLFHGQRLVPASLRGVHAWLARDSHLARQVIEADPMGIVEYGDAGCLEDDHARALLEALSSFCKRDPRYHDFDKTHSLRGIAGKSLCDDLKRLIVSEDTPSSLRVMLLHAVAGSPAAAALATTLEAVVLDPEREFPVRRVAGYALARLPRDIVEWKEIFAGLCDLSDASSPRIAVELLPDVEFAGSTDKQIVELVIALMRSDGAHISGALLGLGKNLPDARIEPFLDILADALEALDGEENDRVAYQDVLMLVHILAARRISSGKADPRKLWRWLSASGVCPDDWTMSQSTVSQWLRDNTEARRTIQRIAFLEDDYAERLSMRVRNLGDSLPGLDPDEDDIVELLGCLDPSDAVRKDRWKELLHLCSHDRQRGATVREAARRFASDPEGQAFLDRLAKRDPEDGKTERAQMNRRREEERQKDRREYRKDYRKHIDQVRGGVYGSIIGPAEAYLKLYAVTGKAVPAHERIEEWLGPKLQEAAFQGFEAFLMSENAKPSAREVADAYAQNKRWEAAFIFIVAVAERVRNGRSLEDIADDRLLAILLEIRFTHILDRAEIGHVAEAVQEEIEGRGLWERFWRLRTEPQLQAGFENVDGLYELARYAGDTGMAARLAEDWLKRFPEMPYAPEVLLVDCLISAGACDVLRECAARRRSDKGVDGRRRSTWDVVAFLADYENAHEALEGGHSKDKGFLWHLRDRLERRDVEGSPVLLSAAQLSWIIRIFRSMWPYASFPTGRIVGNENPWDAAEYITSLISRLGGLTTDRAVEELSALCNAPTDGYSDHLKSTFAEQARKAVEEKFEPPSITGLAETLNDGAPTSAGQLQAIMLEELSEVQKKIGGHPADWYKDFLSDDVDGVPGDEPACRDALLKMLEKLPFGIQCGPEPHLADKKRADIECRYEDLMLPIETKGQWHKDLWHAADTQLQRLYSNDWRADRKGIYLVFWFGEEVPENKKLKSPGKDCKRPATADELRSQLIENSPAARNGHIEIVVLDLSRPSSQ